MSRYMIVAFALCIAATHPQQAHKAPAPKSQVSEPTDPSPALTNNDVVKLVRAGLGENLVINSIRQAKSTAFDTSPDGLVRLKSAGVSDAIIAVILNPATPAPAPVAPPASPIPRAPVAASTDPYAAPREPGLYMDLGGGPDKLIGLEPTVFSQGKSGGFLASAMTYGLMKAKFKAVVRSPRANIRATQMRPTFYFYFENKSSGLSGSGGFAGWLASASSPNEFVLAQMTEKKDSRELIVGEFGALGASSGARSEDTVPFSVQKLAPGIYRVTPNEDLGRGEFCFFFAGGAPAVGPMGGSTVGKLFDFGVDER